MERKREKRKKKKKKKKKKQKIKKIKRRFVENINLKTSIYYYITEVCRDMCIVFCMIQRGQSITSIQSNVKSTTKNS